MFSFELELLPSEEESAPDYREILATRKVLVVDDHKDAQIEWPAGQPENTGTRP